jgi:hypothetical protein
LYKQRKDKVAKVRENPFVPSQVYSHVRFLPEESTFIALSLVEVAVVVVVVVVVVPCPLGVEETETEWLELLLLFVCLLPASC